MVIKRRERFTHVVERHRRDLLSLSWAERPGDRWHVHKHEEKCKAAGCTNDIVWWSYEMGTVTVYNTLRFKMCCECAARNFARLRKYNGRRLTQ